MQQPDETSSKTTRQWSGRAVGAGWQYNFFYCMIRIGGRRLAYLIAYGVVFYYTLFTPSQRAKTKYYLDKKFPGKNSFGRFTDSFRMILNLAKILIDRAVTGTMGMAGMHVTLHGREALLNLLDEKKGVILMMSHVGCWQVALSALNFLNVPVNLLMHQEEGDVDRHYFEQHGLSSMFKIIDPNSYLGGTLDMLAALKNNEVLSVMGDRVIQGSSNIIHVPFLGKEVPFHYSPFKIASASGSPIVVLFSYKTSPDSYELKVARIIRVPKNLGRSGKVFSPYVEQYVHALESYTDEHPYQFLNFYDMWGTKT